MLASVWNVLDFLAFFPPLMEVVLMHGANLPFRLGRFDLRWFKILRLTLPFKIHQCCVVLLGIAQLLHACISKATLHPSLYFDFQSP
jgi:hypothetical protein